MFFTGTKRKDCYTPPMQGMLKTAILRLELAVFMLGVPLLLWLALPPKAILPAVWGMAGLCYILMRTLPMAAPPFWHWQALTWRNLRPILARFALCAAAMLAAIYIAAPNLLFGFVRERPTLWALVMLLYPLISVVPQEVIFRRYLFERHAAWLKPPLAMLLISGLGFGFAHIVFNNWVAPALCAIGGVLFAHTYQRTRSLALVCIEHALYGDFLFTAGLGRYFYHGAVAAA